MTIAEKYKIFDRMLEGVQVISPQGQYVYVNNAVASQAKRTKEELSGSNIYKEYPGFEETELHKKIQACYTNNEANELINKFDFPDGTTGYFLLRLEPVEEGVLILSSDITDLKKAELIIKIHNKQLEGLVDEQINKIQEQKEIIENKLQEILKLSDSFQAILDNTTDSIVLISPHHKVLCFNNEIKQALYLYFEKEISIGDDYRNFVIDTNKELYLHSFDRALKGETILIENETVEGSVAIWFQYKVNPVYDNAKQILGVTLTATNIDARKKKEIALQQSEETIRTQAEKIATSERYFRTLIETSSAAIVLMDSEGKVLYQTPSTERITGYTLSEIQSIEGITLIHPDDREFANLNFMNLITSPNDVINLKLRLRSKKGDYIWLDCAYRNLLNDENVKAIVLNYTDISDRVQSQQNIEKFNRELNLLNTINDLILRCEDEYNIYEEVCKCIIKSGGYKLAWVCLKPQADAIDQSINPLVAFGETEYLKGVKLSLKENDLPQGPTATVLRTGKPAITHDIIDSDIFKPWVDNAKKYGIASSLALPLDFKNGEIGALNIYSAHTNSFDIHEVLILERIASNISLAVKNIRNRVEKDRNKYLLQERIKELTTIYKVNEILQNVHWEASKIFTEIVKLLPPGWQYPDVCAAQIYFDGEYYRTSNYTATEFKQSANIDLHDGRKGFIEVVYTREMPQDEEGPFLKEERELINSIAETIQVYFNKASQQRALIESEARFRGAFENAAIGMALVSLNGQWLMVNHALCEMLGYTKEELLRINFQQITHPEDLENDLTFLQNTLKGEIDFYRMQKRYFCKDGSIIWINLNVSLIRDNKKNPLYFVSQIENISARKQSEEALLQSEANLKSIFDNTHIGYLLMDKNFNIISFNDQMKHGYAEETGIELRERDNLIKLLLPDKADKVRIVLENVINTGRPLRYETDYTNNGHTNYFNIDVVPIVSHNTVIGACLSSYDITDRKNMELERQRIINDLASRNRDLEEFSDILSHNVKGPVSTLLGLSNMIKYEKDEDDRNYILDSIENSANQLDSIIKELNEILYVKNSLSDIKTKVELNCVVRDVTGMLENTIREKNALIQYDFSDVPTITSVHSYLNNIFYNLISNGIKYRHPARIPEIHISAKKLDAKYILTFSDNGIGIDLNKHREQMFGLHKRFHIVNQGRGLGLYMVKTQVMAMNGTIEVDSTPGVGTSFTITLPEL